MKLKIGLIGEDPNDTLSIQNLLLQKHSGLIQFKQLIRNKKGYQLNNSRTDAALKVEFEDFKPQYVLFIRDADALPSEKAKIKRVQEWFNKLNPIVNNQGILLMNIYELEALILADIETFNNLYGTSIQFKKNCMYQKEPKEFLIQKTSNNKKSYSESHCPGIFKTLKIDTVERNCIYFKEFHSNFKKILKIK